MTQTISPIAPPASSAPHAPSISQALSKPRAPGAPPAPGASPASPASSSSQAPRTACGASRACTRPAGTETEHRKHRLGGYTDSSGRERALIAVPRQDGCVLVVDRDSLTLGDRRLVACIAPEEPQESAAAVCALYLSDSYKACRLVDLEDLKDTTVCAKEPVGVCDETAPGRCLAELTKRSGQETVVYTLELVGADEARADDLRIRGEIKVQLCWRRRSGGAERASTAVSLREVVGELESYEPACELTSQACAAYSDDPLVASAKLLNQLVRLRESPIVLNRGLREAVLGAGTRRGLSMGEIALRCGRVKAVGKGLYSGETSWLARRVGIMPESGASRATPWVHSDVLALIARDGLGMSPREVELG